MENLQSRRPPSSLSNCILEVDQIFLKYPFQSYVAIANKHADALASFKVDVLDEGVDVKVIKRTLRVTTIDLVPIDLFDEKD